MAVCIYQYTHFFKYFYPLSIHILPGEQTDWEHKKKIELDMSDLRAQQERALQSESQIIQEDVAFLGILIFLYNCGFFKKNCIGIDPPLLPIPLPSFTHRALTSSQGEG